MTETTAGHAVRAELTASVFRILTEVGASVARGDQLMILESMKMEIPVIATRAGIVASIEAAPDTVVNEGDVLARIAEAS
ncbi:biotin/lipoyl-binding carrier protein [Nocardia australiensis]|uniref:biotin/lipoyl-binding carrier protein n=1 Tax=Nocardia australiensis TaxID=2887191 RepID=UPI001D13AA52|nr:biotin/lipoyl-binding carrier protein [Nocardia australiensis]